LLTPRARSTSDETLASGPRGGTALTSTDYDSLRIFRRWIHGYELTLTGASVAERYLRL